MLSHTMQFVPTKFGRIFMTISRKDFENKTNASCQILRLLGLTMVCVKYYSRVENGFCVTFAVPKISGVTRD